MERRHGVRESFGVVEPDDGASLAARKKVSLPAVVVTHDRQAEGHRLEEHQSKALVLTGGNEGVGNRQRGVLGFVRDLAEHVNAIADAELRGALADRRRVRTVAHDQQMCIVRAALRQSQNVDELGRRLARDQPSDCDHHEGVFRHAERGARRGRRLRRPFDPQGNQFDAPVHAVDLAYMTHRIARLSDHGVGLSDQRSHGGSQRRVPMRGTGFARIEKIAAVHRENIGNPAPARESVPERARRDDEMRVDHVERTAEGETACEAARQIRKHRRQVGDGELTAEEDGRSHHLHPLIVAHRWQSCRAGSERGHFVSPGELPGECGHHHTAAAAQRGILVVAEQDLHC